jgi:hypothetical protein
MFAEEVCQRTLCDPAALGEQKIFFHPVLNSTRRDEKHFRQLFHLVSAQAFCLVAKIPQPLADGGNGTAEPPSDK